MTQIFDFLFLLYWLLSTQLSTTDCSNNVDTQFPIVYSKPADTYFGYSVLLHSNNDGYWLLVGGPRANQTNFPELRQPGALFRCKYGPGNDCNELQLENKGNIISTDRRRELFSDLKDNGWLGASLDSNPDGLVAACAFRWKNQRYYQLWKDSKQKTSGIQDYHSNGLCYTIEEDLAINSAKRHLPLIEMRFQVSSSGRPLFSFGMAGISAHFATKDDLILGAPGVYSWEGLLVQMSDLQKQPDAARNWTSRNEGEKGTNSMYLGYSLTSGKFFVDDPAVYYVVGAPRFQYLGKIYIVKMSKKQSILKFQWKGTQLGEYFGAAVCATDVNNDGFDDLIVGAPLYADEGKVDEGKVYLFMNKNGEDFLFPLELRGSKVPRARFGTTLANLGDLNLDDYNDFAIGAPYENENGVVYIVYGDKSITVDFSRIQKLEAKNIDRNLRGFGISFSRTKDVDNNNYPDLAIGSYESGHAVILRTRPVVSLTAMASASPNKVNISSYPCTFENKKVRCFNVTVCINSNSARTLQPFNITYELKIDPWIPGENARGFFNTSKSILRGFKQLRLRRSECEVHYINLRNDIRDYDTPVKVLYNLELKHENLTAFCSKCPVLDPKSKTSVEEKVSFLKECGDDEICRSDLKLVVKIIDEKNNIITDPIIWPDVNKTVIFQLEVSNSGDDAYSSELNITTPDWCNFDNLDRFMCRDQFQNENDQFTICNIGNPLPKNSVFKKEFYLSLDNMPLKTKFLPVTFHVKTTNEEQEEKLIDNYQAFNISCRYTADVTVLGSTTTEYVAIGNLSQSAKLSIPVIHVFEVVNRGPSTLNKVNVKFQIPEKSLNGKTSFIHNISLTTRDGHFSAVVEKCTGADTDHQKNDDNPGVTIIVPGSNSRRKRDTAKDIVKGTELFCKNAQCREVKCEVRDLKSKDIVKMIFTINVIPNALHELKLEGDVINYMTKGEAFILDPPGNIQPPKHEPDYAQIITSFDTGRALKKKTPSWVIPVSVLFGILLLLAVIAMLYKCGFFKRAQRDQLKQAQEDEDVDNAEQRNSRNAFSSQNNLLDEIEMPEAESKVQT